MSTPATIPSGLEAERRFDWPLCYEAERWFERELEEFFKRNGFAASLSERMRRETATLFIDWIDHITLSPERAGEIEKLGFRAESFGGTGSGLLAHPEAMLPRVRILDGGLQVVLKVESVSDFILAHGRQEAPIEGSPFSGYRVARVASEQGTALHVSERRGFRGLQTDLQKPAAAWLEACELWKTRPRAGVDEAAGFAAAHSILDRMIALVGRDGACHLVFLVEREYWEKRNRAAQFQKARQDRLGLGWANHDHHTFRSSRKFFVELMSILEKLGFQRRERYYAGAAAGWGAQILEQPVEGIVTFCDVDLQPEETEVDFSRQPLPESNRLGTIGLWVGLHGESFLSAGMHHLEARFDYALLREQMDAAQMKTMAPFSDFPFLKQAFTEGERWPVDRERAERLLSKGLINREQFEKFVAEGAIGSHLENLQRRGGFKGFNQKSVSVIIQATDPRKQQAAGPSA